MYIIDISNNVNNYKLNLKFKKDIKPIISIPFYWVENEKEWIRAITLLRNSGLYINRKRECYRIFFNYIELVSKRGIELAKNYRKNKQTVGYENIENPRGFFRFSK